MGEKFKKKVWGWMWTEAGKQTQLEEAVGVGGAGFPVSHLDTYHSGFTNSSELSLCISNRQWQS